jgi:hypothetical protein
MNPFCFLFSGSLNRFRGVNPGDTHIRPDWFNITFPAGKRAPQQLSSFFYMMVKQTAAP